MPPSLGPHGANTGKNLRQSGTGPQAKVLLEEAQGLNHLRRHEVARREGLEPPTL